MNKRTFYGVICVIIMFLSLAFAFQTPYHPAIGDKVLNKIGFKAWSGGNTGTHYTAIYSFVIYILSLRGATYYLKDKYSNILKTLLLATFIIMFLSIIIISNLLKLLG